MKASLDNMPAEFARWRVWAAEVRDGSRQDCPAASEQAQILVRILDCYQAIAARPGNPTNLCDGMVEAIVMLIEQLLTTFHILPPAPLKREE